MAKCDDTRYERRTKQADALIAGPYLSGTNTRRVRRPLEAQFGGAVGKDSAGRSEAEVSPNMSKPHPALAALKRRRAEG